MLKKISNKLFGSYNQKTIEKIQPNIPKINEQEIEFQKLSDLEIKAKFQEWKKFLTQNPEKIEEKIIEVFAGIKNAARRLEGHKYEVQGKPETWNMIPYDVQLIGGIVLHQGRISEMKTGEGKTLVCTLPVILNALSSQGVHVVTVNDYLAQRDSEWMKPLYEFCGLSVGVVINEASHEARKSAYEADITYGTNNEFGFDYLRDNMAQSLEKVVQRDLNYAIVDEVDSILIDEARTPLIISTTGDPSTDKYQTYSQLIPQLKENEDYNVDLKSKQVLLSEAGIKTMESLLGVENIFTEAGFDEVHHIESALKAQVIMVKDQDYVVRDNKVIIIDEFTGRMMAGRRYSDGLHQALEAKEKVEIQPESKTLATITFQNYFRLYKKLAGMTGTAETEAEEFAKIYKLDTLVIPTNKPLARKDLSDKIFKNERGKFLSLVKTVQGLHKNGQPVLIGTINIDKSEVLSQLLDDHQIPHEVLNAKHHAREAEIIAKAGESGAVTIATNMAGRGTDIKISEAVKELGGLAILGTERHESRRIDNQLRGRSGRQGDPGFSQFYVSMSDDLMRRFGGEKMGGLMEKLGLPEEEAIENSMISRSVENAQKKIEGYHFDSRKHVVQYDDVMNIHREKIYKQRKEILHTEDLEAEVEQLVKNVVKHLLETHAPGTEIDPKADLQEITETILQIHTDRENPLSQSELEVFHYQEDLKESLENYLLESWDKKVENFPPEFQENTIRQILLRSIDELWLEHIDEMTHLRDRVALSGYAQKDPIIEYKAEGFHLFKKLLFNIQNTAISNLFRVDLSQNLRFEEADYSDAVTNASDIEKALESGNLSHGGNSGAGAITLPQGSVQEGKLGKSFANVGRNDICPCGSGKKFKKCHGKNL